MEQKQQKNLLIAESWNSQKQVFERSESLLAALGFADWRTLPRVVSLVGAGGKTSTMYDLARELADAGANVLVTTSTHIMKPEHGCCVVTDRLEHWNRSEFAAQRQNGGEIWVAGKQAAGKGAEQKLTMPDDLGDEKIMKQLFSWFDIVLIEADGSKRLPLKVPSETEPVLVPQTGLVIACAGLSAGTKTFEEACFRFASQGSWLKRSAKDSIQPEDMALILMDERGSHKGVAGRCYRIVLNQADSIVEQKQAEEIARLLPLTMQDGCVRTSRMISGEKK